MKDEIPEFLRQIGNDDEQLISAASDVINKIVSIVDIKNMHPEQWVLIGNPLLRNPESNGSIHNRLISGIVILANKDKRELVQHP